MTWENSMILCSCFITSSQQEASEHYPNHQKHVPTHFMSVDPHWNSKGPGQSKVRQFNHPLVIYQEILRFQVSVQNSSWVAEDNTLQNLVQVTLERMRWEERREGVTFSTCQGPATQRCSLTLALPTVEGNGDPKHCRYWVNINQKATQINSED